MVKIAANDNNMQIGNFYNILALKVLKILYGKSLVLYGKFLFRKK